MNILLTLIIALVLTAIAYVYFVDKRHTALHGSLGKGITLVDTWCQGEVARLRGAIETLEEKLSPPIGAIVPTVGRIVNYILPDGPAVGQIRPAIIVRVWPGADGKATVQSLVQLQVFMDGSGSATWNDCAPNLAWKTSVHQGLTAGTWHLPRVNAALLAAQLAETVPAPSPEPAAPALITVAPTTPAPTDTAAAAPSAAPAIPPIVASILTP